MTKKEIFDYIKHTPLNTNFNILSDMLDELVGGGGEGGSNFMVVNFTGEGVLEEDHRIYADELVADKTFEEVAAAYKAGIPVFGRYSYNFSFNECEIKTNYSLPLNLSLDASGLGGELYFCSAHALPDSPNYMDPNTIRWSTSELGIKGCFMPTIG